MHSTEYSNFFRNGALPCVVRGGNYMNGGSYYAPQIRDDLHDSTDRTVYDSFRVILYLKII